MAYSSPSLGLLCLIVLLCCASPVLCFGAGDIASTSKIEGQNWRHGDIENTLLTLMTARAAGGKKFSKLDVKRIYFGNWLRDYSQAVDVGTVKHVSAEAIRILLWILGFMSFGYGTKEFEVTTARLGCYRPEEHIDNPKNYADNEDARQYDRRLRGPIDERRELSIDEDTGMKNYIANERAGIDTSAGLLRKLFGRSIQLGRQYGRSNNKDDLYEALRLLGTGLHCLEDYSAHSNYVELALIELGERNVFPHVGRRTEVQVRGLRRPVYPICTGTFGGVDFLHSVMGEFNDKATQSEIQELESTMTKAQNNKENTSALQDLLDKIPDGMLGGDGQGKKADDLKQNAQSQQMQNTRISPRQPEEWLRYLNDTQKQIFPVLEWHDDIMKSISETIDKIPILPDLMEEMQDQLNVFVFSILAPYIVPIINQVKAELSTGSSEIIQSSVAQQHIVFNDDNCSDPTHSMLSKDHFSNVLNEPAGKVASQVLKWVVPQLIACWDDEDIDVNRTITRIINGVFHHPALRDHGQDGASDGRRELFGIVEEWWTDKSEREKDGLREQLSRRGVESGRNHKPGVVDHGHGCNKPLGVPTLNTAQSSTAIGGPAASAVLGGISQALGGNSGDSRKHRSDGTNKIGKMAGDAVGGGALGSIVGGIAGGLLGGAFGGDKKKNEKTEKHGEDGSYSQTQNEYGQSGSHYGQAQYSRTEKPGGREEQYTRYEQQHSGSGGYGAQQFTDTARYDSRGNQTYRQQESSSTGGYGSESRHHLGGGRESSPSHKNRDNSNGDSDDNYKKQKKREKKERKQRKKHGGKRDSDDNYDDSEDSDDSGKKKYGNQYGSQGTSGYGGDRRHDDVSGGGRQTGGYGRQDDSSSGRYGRDDTYGSGTSGYQHGSSGGHAGGNTYGRDTGSGYSGGGSGYGQETTGNHGGNRASESSYGRDAGVSHGGGNTYGRESESSYGGGAGSNYSRETGGNYGGGSTYGRENESSYGGGGASNYGQSSQSGYGRDDSYGGGGGGGQEMPGGFGNDNNEGGYGGSEGISGNRYGSGGGRESGGGYGDNGDRRRYDGGY